MDREEKISLIEKIVDLIASEAKDMGPRHAISAGMIGLITTIKVIFPDSQKEDTKKEINRMFDLYFDGIKIQADNERKH